ncbi:hypothetical protein [Pseudoalteromonas aliena]|uniref:hypothetical protein n=1 Tax=Pseudoalteromonas aliena TaxID=247523 RepID=UPI00249543ED|nr:hypothetical protein [Pseudoalteromonas aliena]
METRAGSHKLYERNFSLTEAHLRKIHSVMDTYSNKLKESSDVIIHIIREDESFYETLDLETILVDENTEGKSIKSLTMEIRSKTEEGNDKSSKRKNTKALVEFELDYNATIRVITSHHSRDWCFLLVDELDTQIQRIIKKKSRSFVPLHLIDLFLGLILIAAGLVWFAFLKQKEKVDVEALMLKGVDDKLNYLVSVTADYNNSNTYMVLPVFFGAMLLVMLLVSFKPLSKLLRLTSLSVFYWGDMISIYDASIQKEVRIKWGVIVAFVVSLAASFVGSWVT